MRTSKDKEKILKYLKMAEIVAAIEEEWGAPVPADKLRGLQRKIQRELENRPAYNPLVGYKLAANKVGLFIASLSPYLEEKTYTGVKTYAEMTRDRYARAQDAEEGARQEESYAPFGISSEEAFEKLYKACVIAQTRALFPGFDVRLFLEEMNELEVKKGLTEGGRFESPQEEMRYLALKDRVEEALLGNLEIYSKEA